MSLDKVESSNPNLKAAHAGASTRKPQHLQPKASVMDLNSWLTEFRAAQQQDQPLSADAANQFFDSFESVLTCAVDGFHEEHQLEQYLERCKRMISAVVRSDAANLVLADGASALDSIESDRYCLANFGQCLTRKQRDALIKWESETCARTMALLRRAAACPELPICNELAEEYVQRCVSNVMAPSHQLQVFESVRRRMEGCFQEAFSKKRQRVELYIYGSSSAELATAASDLDLSLSHPEHASRLKTISNQLDKVTAELTEAEAEPATREMLAKIERIDGAERKVRDLEANEHLLHSLPPRLSPVAAAMMAS